MFVKRNKVQPIPQPQQPKEVIIKSNPVKKTLKWLILVFILSAVSIGLWLAYSANKAIKNITSDSGGKSSILSLLTNDNYIKGKAEGRTNILLLGMGGSNHPGGLLSDTMIVLSIDYTNNKIAMLSVPRDLWVPISGYGHAKINEAYADGEKNKSKTGGGGALASRTVEQVLGIPIHYYFRLDFEGFKKIVDSVGGVDIYVEKDLNDPFYPAENMIDYAPLHITAGQHHFDGATALKYARSRETTSDFDRSRRQMQVMLAVKEKITSLDILANPKKITDLINILGDHIRTNMTVKEIKALWDATKTLDTQNMINEVLDTAADSPLKAAQDTRGYYIYPKKGIDNFSDLQQIAKNIFNLQKTAEAATIEVTNSSGRTGMGNTVSHLLESYNYNVQKVDTGSNKVTKTVVYDFTGGIQKETAQKIADILHCQVEVNTATRTSIDIQVVVGQDYLTNQ